MCSAFALFPLRHFELLSCLFFFLPKLLRLVWFSFYACYFYPCFFFFFSSFFFFTVVVSSKRGVSVLLYRALFDKADANVNDEHES